MDCPPGDQSGDLHRGSQIGCRSKVGLADSILHRWDTRRVVARHAGVRTDRWNRCPRQDRMGVPQEDLQGLQKENLDWLHHDGHNVELAGYSQEVGRVVRVVLVESLVPTGELNGCLLHNIHHHHQFRQQRVSLLHRVLWHKSDKRHLTASSINNRCDEISKS